MVVDLLRDDNEFSHIPEVADAIEDEPVAVASETPPITGADVDGDVSPEELPS